MAGVNSTKQASLQDTLANQSPRLPARQDDEKLQRKKDRLMVQVANLESKIRAEQKELDEMNAQLGSVDAEARVKQHIKLLHQYNELKDVGMTLMGTLAEQRGVRVREVMAEFGIEETD